MNVGFINKEGLNRIMTFPFQKMKAKRGQAQK